MPDIFFYGLFMDDDLLRAQGMKPARPRRGSVDGFALRIGRRATLVPDPAGRVHGTVVELSFAEIDRLYAEPSLRDYRPRAVIVGQEAADPVAALCFVLPEPPAAQERNEDYAARLKDVAARLGLPDGYVRSIA